MALFSRPAMRYVLHSFGSFFNWLLFPLVCELVVLRPVIADLESVLPTGGDGLLNMYFLENNSQLWRNISADGIYKYLSPDFFWPVNNVFAYSDHLFLPGAVYSLIRLLAPFALAYNLWLLLTVLLNYWSLRSALLLLVEQRRPFLASLIAVACVFAPVSIQDGLGHVQLLSLFWIGPILLVLQRQFSSSSLLSVRRLILVLIFLILQLLVSIYTFVFIAYCLCVALLVQFAFRFVACRSWLFSPSLSFRGLKSALSWLLKELRYNKYPLVILLFAFSFAFVLHIPYLKTIVSFGDRGRVDPLQTVQPLSLFNGAKELLLLSPLDWSLFISERPSIAGWEQVLFPGYLFSFLLLASILVFVNIQVHFNICSFRFPSTFGKNIDGSGLLALSKWLALLLVAVIGAVQLLPDHSLYSLAANLIPGSRALRVPSRIVPVFLYFSAPFLYLSLSRLACRVFLGFRFLLSVFALLSFSRFDFGHFDFREWNASVRSIIDGLVANKCDIFFVSEARGDDGLEFHVVERHLLAMHAQQYSGIPTISGTSGFIVQDGYPYEKGSADGVNAVGWAIFQSRSGRTDVKKSSDNVRACDVSFSLRSDEYHSVVVKTVNPGQANYPKSVYRQNGIILVRGNRNTIFFSWDSDASWPVFEEIMSMEGVSGELVDIDGFEISDSLILRDKLYLVDTPIRGRGKRGFFLRRVDLRSKRVEARDYYSEVWDGGFPL